MRPSDPVLLFVAQLSSLKKVKRTSQKMTEVENNPILRSCEDEPRRPVPTQLEHVPRRWPARGSLEQGRRILGKKTSASRGETRRTTGRRRR